MSANSTAPDTDELIALIARLADVARTETSPRFRAGAPADDKNAGGDFDPVTDADREGERAIRVALADARPHDGVLGEEFPELNGSTGYRWVLDPVDGTRAFVCGLPSWTTLIGLEKDGAPVLGLIDQPYTDERWIGGFGQARFHRGGEERAISTSALEDLAEARIACTDPRPDGYFTIVESRAFAELSNRARIARFGFDAYAFAMLAMGEHDIVVDAHLKAWDAVGPIALIEAAGGVATDWTGAPFGSSPGGRIVASANAALHEQALAILSQAPETAA